MTTSQSNDTYCRICEAACGLQVIRDDKGQPKKLLPDRSHPVSQGFVCAKGMRFLDVANHPARLQRPMQRAADGSLKPISWTQAYEEIGARLRPILERYGPHAVGIYFGNPLAFNAQGIATMYAMLKTIGTHNTFTAGSQDCNNKLAAASLLHGSPVIHPLPDLAHAEQAIFFGTNPAISQSSFVHLEGGVKVLDALKARGGRITFVDVRETESARRWGDAVVLKPGTDIYLLLALLREVDDGQPYPQTTGLTELRQLAASFPVTKAASLTGLSPDVIWELVDMLKRPVPTALHMSVGVNQGPFGTLSYMVLQALALVSGSFDRRGGNVFHPWAPWIARIARLTGMDRPHPPSRIGGFPSVLGTYPGGILAEEITTPGKGQIKALICVAGDPLRSIPGSPQLREALASLDTLIAIDLFENETGALADYLLPTTCWLERWDVATTTAFFQTSPWLQWAGPVTPPPKNFDVRHEAEIMIELCRHMKRPLLGHSALAWLWRQATNDQRLTRWSRTAQRPLQALQRLTTRTSGGTKSSNSHPPQVMGFPSPEPAPGAYVRAGTRHPDGKLHFWHPSLEAESQRLHQHADHCQRLTTSQDSTQNTDHTEQRGQAMQLLCRRRKIGHNSWLHGGQRDGNPEALAWLSPADHQRLLQATPQGDAGHEIELQANGQRLQLPALAQDGVKDGTIVLPHGLPGLNVNALIPSGVGAIEPLSGQHLMTGIAVQVKAVQPTASRD